MTKRINKGVSEIGRGVPATFLRLSVPLLAALAAPGRAQVVPPPSHMCFTAEMDGFPTLGTTHASGCEIFNTPLPGGNPVGSHWVPSGCWWPRLAAMGLCSIQPPPPPPDPERWDEGWEWLNGGGGLGTDGGFPLNVDLNIGVGPAGLPPISYDPAEGTSPLVPASRNGSGQVRWPRTMVGSTVDGITGTPLLREVDFELPFGSATFRHLRTYGQYHELRHELLASADQYDHIVRRYLPGGDFWESAGHGWTVTTSPILLIDVGYKVLAGDPVGPRRCIFMPDAHHAISFVQDATSGEFVAPAHFGAQLSHNGAWEYDPSDANDGRWVIRPTVFRIWLYDGTVCYTVRALYEDVFPGFLPTEDDRDSGMYSDNDPVASLGACYNSLPYWGLCERIDDRYGNCIDIEYCQFLASDWGNDPECQACTVNYNEKGQVARIRLVSGVSFNAASDWAADSEWDQGSQSYAPLFDWADQGLEDEVEWTLLFTYRSFWESSPYGKPEPDPNQDIRYPLTYARENAIHSIHVYQGDKEPGLPPTCRTIDFAEFYNPAGDGEGLGEGGGWWKDYNSEIADLDPIDSLEQSFYPELGEDWDFAVHYMYAEPHRGDMDPDTQPFYEAAGTRWYDAAYGYSCRFAAGAARLLKTTVTERVRDEGDGAFEDATTYRLYRYDTVGTAEIYVFNDQQMTTLQHVYDHGTIMAALEHLNEGTPQNPWTVNHLISGVGPWGEPLADVDTFPVSDIDGDTTDTDATWTQLAPLSLYAWDGYIYEDGPNGSASRDNGLTGDWQGFEVSDFAKTLAGSQFAALERVRCLFMQPGVALLAERGAGGQQRYYRLYRFYVAHQPYDVNQPVNDKFTRWSASRSPLRSVLHEPYRMPDYDSSMSWNTGQAPAPRLLSDQAWVIVIDEYESLAAASVTGGWSQADEPRVRRAVYLNAAGSVLMDRMWEFTDDGVVMNSEGYTETYGYDEHGRLTHIYSGGFNTLDDAENDARGLVSRIEYWPAAERDGALGIKGPLDIPHDVRAKGVQAGEAETATVYYSEVTERYEESGEIVRFDLVTALHRFDPPTRDIESFTSTPTTTSLSYDFVKDANGDGQDDSPKDWVIIERTTLGPVVHLDDSADEYRARETQLYDEADDDDNGLKRGRLRWRVYGMEPVTTGPLATRFFDYYHYDRQGRVVRQVVDAAVDPDAFNDLGTLVDHNGRYEEYDIVDIDLEYPGGEARVAPGFIGDAKHKVTKTLFSSRGPLVIEHADGTQTQMSHRRSGDGSTEVRTARGFTALSGEPHGPGQVARTGFGAPSSIKHVVWDAWEAGDKLKYHDYTVIAETSTETDASGRPTSATQTDWRGNERKVEARLDRFGAVSRQLEPDLTISRTQGDARGRPERLFVGTEDGDIFWTNGIDSGPDNMVLTEHRAYGAGVTDAGMQTHTRLFSERPIVHDQYQEVYPLDFANEGRLQETRYDWRLRPIWQAMYEQGSDSVPLRHTITIYDNLDRVRFVAGYGPTAPQPDGASDNAITFGGVVYDGKLGMPEAQDILGTSPLTLTETVYNGAGQVESVIEYDPEALLDTEFLAARTYYDRKNNETFKIQPSTAATITENDAEGRVMSRCTVLDPFDADPYEISRTEYVYDDQGRQIEVANYERTHDGTGTRLQLGVNAVVTWQWSWYDYNGRLKATASVGAGDGSSDQLVNPTAAPERPVDSPSLSVAGAVGRGALPEHAILTCYRYDAAGKQSAVATQLTGGANPTYRFDRSYYDGMGNLRFSKENAAGAAGQVRKTAYKYDSLTGQLTHIAAVLPGHEMLEYIGFEGQNPETDSAVYIEPTWDAADGTLQVTRIEYGAEVYTGEGQPTSQHNGWVKAVYLPHPETGQPSPTPSLTFTYTIDGLVRTRTDALGRTFTHTYDQFGKRTLTTIDYNWPANDPYAVYRPLDLADRLEYDYDDRDRLIRATAIRVDNGADVIIADNTYAYDARGNLLAEQQSYGNAASPDPRAGDPKEVVQYTWDYANYAAGNHLRLETMEYPQRIQTGTTREVKFEYGDTEDPGSDSLSRISAIHDLLADVRAEFAFAGVGRRVGVETTRDASTAPATVWGQSFAAAGVVGYPGLDRHGRPTDLHFVDGAGDDIHRYEYSYNAAGDRLSSLVRQVGEVNTRSWAYGYDQLSRLVTAERGTLLADHSGIDHYTATVAERTSWGLDTLGNWTEPSGLNGLYAGRVAEAFESGTGEYSLLLEAQAHTTDQRNRLEQIEITEGNTPTTTDTHVYDHAGQLVADAEYWYQYDAFGRLASVHGRGDLTFLSSGTISGGTPGAWRLYLAYDGLGRLIREQKPWEGGTDHRQAWFYYDGVRRICEVYKDPIVGAAVPLGAAPGGGYTTYTEREYVWGPDYVDECLWQVTKPGGVLHVLQDASKDVVALLDEAGAVARQYSYDPYGQVQFEDVFGTPAHSRLGHHGLFFDRLDADAPAVELGVGARGLYHNRNRTYDPRTGRFTTSDPNGTGVALLMDTLHGAEGGWLNELSVMDAFATYGDGMSLYGYAASSPGRHSDPMGLFVSDAVDVYFTIGSSAAELAYLLTSEAAANMESDAYWASDWDMPDDFHTRGDASWIRGVYAMVDIQGAVDGFLNPLAMGGAGDYVKGSRVLRRVLWDGRRVLRGAEHHAFFRIYTRYKESVKEVIVKLPHGMHRRYHTYVDRRVRQIVGKGCPSIWDPRGAKHWQTWLGRNPGVMDEIIGGVKKATREFEIDNKVKGLLEALEAALP